VRREREERRTNAKVRFDERAELIIEQEDRVFADPREPALKRDSDKPIVFGRGRRRRSRVTAESKRNEEELR
jgi:hypothetical protein